MPETKNSTKKRAAEKSAVDRYIGPYADFLIRHNVSPNMLSFFGFACALLAAIILGLGTIHLDIWFAWPAPFLLFLSGTFDVFDGEVARRTRTESQGGAFLDSNLDRISDAAIILGLIYGGFLTFLLGFITLFIIIMISYTRSRAENEGVDMKGIGIMERAERVLTLFTALILETWIFYLSRLITGNVITIHIPFITSIPVTYFWLIFIIAFIVLLTFTVFQRILFTFKSLSQAEEKKE